MGDPNPELPGDFALLRGLQFGLCLSACIMIIALGGMADWYFGWNAWAWACGVIGGVR